MCIRDSARHARGNQAVEVAAMTELIFVIVCMVVVWLWLTCLLYTSDAADERSSVDLGGRRIIKKKKKVDCRRTVSS